MLRNGTGALGGAVPRDRLMWEVERVADLVRRQQTPASPLAPAPAVDLAPLGALWPLTLDGADPADRAAPPAPAAGMESQLLQLAAELFRAPPNWWGRVMPGTYEATTAALHAASCEHPGAMVYCTADTVAVARAVSTAGMPAQLIATLPTGEMDYDDLARRLLTYGHRPAVIVANVGSTTSESVDDVTRIALLCRDLNVTRRWIHAHAPLSGLTLATLPTRARPGFDFADGADSIAIGGQEFLGTPMGSAILLAAPGDAHGSRTDESWALAFLPRSRHAHATVALWYMLRSLGLPGLRQIVETALDNARYAAASLNASGWPAWRHNHAVTVVMSTPAARVRHVWELAAVPGTSHLICTPALSRRDIDDVIAQLTGRTRRAHLTIVR
ncbi:hypothetical protein [Catellatospora chokoriensis]|uniref:hypothetical protein n=1 Tax=Catellatospora chokoriensis TaxID=310353 RepID=UPI00177C2784|nr:hypothetical protein [Catellatospora chokoriensis]